uniref:DUF1618 domain-containing protein n=1 Tax=Oryza punctata TaxID=4537 RepID=A0A0E0MD04_ORYPU
MGDEAELQGSDVLNKHLSRPPQWVMLEHKGHDMSNVREHSAGGYTGDPKTAASACTFAGSPSVRVLFCLEAPPASGVPDVLQLGAKLYATMFITAAHGDSVLIKMEYYDEHTTDDALDYFVYNASDGDTDPSHPRSLMLLPHNYVDATEQDEPNPNMDVRATGILRRGDDELVVAELITKGSNMLPKEAKLQHLHSGEWSLKPSSGRRSSMTTMARVLSCRRGKPTCNVREHSAGGCTGDPKTAASACTFTGRPSVRVLLPGPAASRMFFDLEQNDADATMFVTAAHGDSVLIKMEYYDEHTTDDALDYFVNNADDGNADPAQPPSLTLLPHNYVDATEQDEPNPNMDVRATGILRRGDDKLVVASPSPREATCCRRRPNSNTSTPANGDCRLCWVNLHPGVMLCDPFDESPRLQYVSLPVEPSKSFDDGRRDSPAIKRSVCAATTDIDIGSHKL